MTDEYEVRWFRENTTGEVEDLGLGDPDTLLGMEWISRYHNIAFRNQQYSPSLLGKYWCQVITTADPDQPLMRSNVFTLLAPGNYSGPACTLVQEVGNMTCADLPANQPVGMTTTTVPVLVPTTTTLMAPITVQTPAASSSPSSTPFPTTQDQILPFLYVIASIGGIFLITITVLIVVITVMRLKRGTDHKGIA